MTYDNQKRRAGASVKAKLAILTLAALAAGGCRPEAEEGGGHVAGWALIDHAQRHPIVVSEQPANLALRVTRGAHGLTPPQRAQVISFLNKYRGGDTGNARIAVNVPSGSPNEVAALHAVADLRHLLSEYGIDDTRVAIQPYHTDGEPQPPIRVSYTRYVAEGPSCGHWGSNIADNPRNLPYPNLGCANQRNLAAQVANPADLLGPRTMTPAESGRRDAQWEKFLKGDPTGANKSSDERVQVRGAQ